MSRSRPGNGRTGSSGSSAVGRGRVRVKTARGRKASSTRWLSRHLNDAYVVRAKTAGYRSRAAFKLIELDDRFRFLEAGARVVDLGAAPGGWTQVAVERVGRGNAIAVDVSPMDPVAGALILRADIRDGGAVETILRAAERGVDVVLSDMAPASTGHKSTDHLRIVALAEAAFDVARRVLRPHGAFVAKVYQGGAERELLTAMKASFRTVRHAKPGASRRDSPETYVVATGFGRSVFEP